MDVKAGFKLEVQDDNPFKFFLLATPGHAAGMVRGRFGSDLRFDVYHQLHSVYARFRVCT